MNKPSRKHCSNWTKNDIIDNWGIDCFSSTKQSIRDAMEKDKTRVTADLNPFFGHKPGAAIVGDVEGTV